MTLNACRFLPVNICTSNFPSAIDALGAMFIPPPKNWPLAITMLMAVPSNRCRSTATSTVGTFERASVSQNAVMYFVRPIHRGSLPAMRTAAAATPTSATLTKNRCEPSAQAIRPRSIPYGFGDAIRSKAAPRSGVWANVRVKSLPEPDGTTANVNL